MIGIDVLEASIGKQVFATDWTPSSVQLFRFSSVTWNAHRIHYDSDHSRAEGYPAPIVQAHLHGAVLADAGLTWAGRGARLTGFRWENRQFVTCDETVSINGIVSGVSVDGGVATVALEIEQRNVTGELTVCAWAEIALAADSDRSVDSVRTS